MTTLQVVWFLLIGVLLLGYAILDGFDLGVGFWHLFLKEDRHRRATIQSIGPVWDGNEVWLLTGGGAIFAAFPPVYASVFSGFYLALMLLLVMLILRAVSIEFRSKLTHPGWRRSWDVAFSVGSIVSGLLLGVALGNIMRGIPLDAQGNYTGTFFDLLNPFALVIGLTGLAMFATHGAIYIALKTTGALAERALDWARTAWIAYVILFAVGTAFTFIGHPNLLSNVNSQPILYVVPLIAVATLSGIMFFLAQDKAGRAFLASSLSIASMMGLVGIGIFPNMVPSFEDSSHSLTVFNSSSSQYTLTVMLILALIGVPLVLAYTIWTYRTFAGKVRVDDSAY